MDVWNLVVVFLVIVAVIWWKKPLYLAMIAGIAATILLYRIDPIVAARIIVKQTAAWETVDLLLSFYVIMFLQLMLEGKGRLANAEESFNRLLQNRRMNTVVSPAVMGLLPSAAVMTVCAGMVDKTCADYLDNKSKTFVSLYYRHIPEMFLPTFPVILLAMALSGQNVSIFILAMIPLVILACAVVYFTYLRKLPREMQKSCEAVDKRKEIISLIRNLWTLILVLVIIVAGNLSACIAGPIVILLNFFVDRFSVRDLPGMLLKAVEPVLLGNMYLIMLFKSVLAYTGALTQLPDFFAGFPIPMTLSLCLLFFFGTVISGSQTVVALCMPMAMAALPQEGIPLLVMLMGVVWAAMEVSPTHVCAFVANKYYQTTFNDIVPKALPSVLIFSALCYGYGHLLMLLF